MSALMSAEPQSRVVLDGHSNSLVGHYDVHLKVLADRYLAFFRERFVIGTEASSHSLITFFQEKDRRNIVSRLPGIETPIWQLMFFPAQHRFFAETLSQGESRRCFLRFTSRAQHNRSGVE